MRLRLAVIAASTVAVAATAPAQAQRFTGTVRIDGQAADPGVHVRIAVFRADRTSTSCGEATVGPSGGYALDVLRRPECNSAGDTYEFYVNGVWASSKGNPFSPGASSPAHVNLGVPLLALRTQDAPKARLVWFWGRVTDRVGRAAPPGIEVLAAPAKSLGAGDPCTGIGRTEDLSWTPQALLTHPVNVKGFYWIAIESSPACLDRPITFSVGAHPAGAAIEVVSAQVRTPPYGMPNHVDLTITLP